MVRVILIICFFSIQQALFAQEYDTELMSYETNTSVVKNKLIRKTLNNLSGMQGGIRKKLLHESMKFYPR